MNKVKLMPVARVSLMIRRPRRECFLAFTDPEMLARFWMHEAGDQMVEEGAILHWQTRPDADPITVECRECRPDTLLRLQMSNGVRIMVTLDRHEDGGTLVHYCECGFGPDARAEDVAEATQAAAHMLMSLKTLLETGKDQDTTDRPVMPHAA
ncbi:SRPBCC domain-containing protein [Pseudooceanicola sp. MF1-13]|uniref:SRPBCC domain-containing protein n=1 Tax=Pseudooceanicola sp. MF1-13 TaxID=3379095 RepID=UPI003891A1AF